ncbi:hypothetical protein BC831DRAFT_514438 [Entophlyctis helioformis]|nr:hypothetical protein BC831DRAFT_514438 [Entophlyctis helioformis]
MERLLKGHFARHSRPTPHDELRELAELIPDSLDDFEPTLARLVESGHVHKRIIRVDTVDSRPPPPPPPVGATETAVDDVDVPADASDALPVGQTVMVASWPGKPPPNALRGRRPLGASGGSAAAAAAATPGKPETPPEVLALRAKKERLEREVAALASLFPNDDDIEDFTQRRIKQLHDYNEIKDIGQVDLLHMCVHDER